MDSICDEVQLIRDTAHDPWVQRCIKDNLYRKVLEYIAARPMSGVAARSLAQAAVLAEKIPVKWSASA